MKVVLIGGSGFVGTCLISNLSNCSGIEIRNMDKNLSKVYPELTVIGDVRNESLVIQQCSGADVVILLAAEHRDDVSPVSLYYDVNVLGMINVLKAMESNGIKRLIFTSSVAVYGLNRENPGERSLTDPFNDYGKSKWKAEQVLRSWAKEHQDTTVHILRPTVIFGEGNRGNVYNLLKQIADGRFMMIGKGNNVKSMSYVENVVAFIVYLMADTKPGCHLYNYSDKPDFTTNEIVHMTCGVLAVKVPRIRIPYVLGILGGYGVDVLGFILRKKFSISSIRVKKFCATTQFSSTKMLMSGFQPPFTLEEGLKRMVLAEFSKNKKAIVGKVNQCNGLKN